MSYKLKVLLKHPGACCRRLQGKRQLYEVRRTPGGKVLGRGFSGMHAWKHAAMQG